MTTRQVLVVAAPECARGLLEPLAQHGFSAHAVQDLQAAATVLATRSFEVALLLLDTQHADSGRHFEACVGLAPDCEWVGVFPRGQSESSPWREHILTCFFDHHTYPADLEFLCRSLGHACGRAALRTRSRDGSNGGGGGNGGGDLGMVGESPALRKLRTEIRKAGPSDAPVLIGGESGSGKELVARALHRCSKRAAGPFVPVNCGALASTLIHSELFGHERGSFSGANSTRRGLVETAGGGTLFLDEIAELPMDTQATLLRFLQEGRIMRVGSGQEMGVDVRVIAASHTDLGAAVAQGRFRADLYFRLHVIGLEVPPLRDRREDIPRLARYVFERTTGGRKLPARGFHSEAVEAMLAYGWPGNVRELYNRVQRAMVMSECALLRPQDLGLSSPRGFALDNLQDARVEAEKIAIRSSLAKVSHNVTLAARDLGVSRMTLYRLMAKHSITPRPA